MSTRYVKTVTATYQAVPEDSVILGNTNAAPFTITLPSCGEANGVEITVKNITANTLTLVPKGSDTIEGNASVTMGAGYHSYTVISNGSSSAGVWYILSST